MYRIPITVRIAVSTGLIVMAALGLFSRFSFKQHAAMILDTVSQELAATVRNAAWRLDPADVAAPTPESANRVKALLDELEESNPLEGEFRAFSFTGDGPQLVASSAAEGTEALSRYYDPHDPRAKAITTCLLRKETCVTAPYEAAQAGRWISAFAPIADGNGKLVGALSADRRASEYEKVVRDELTKMAYYAAAALVAALALGAGVSFRITRPLKRLYRASLAARNGDFTPIQASGNDEVAQLTRDFNETNRVLKAKMDELELLNAELEQRVTGRTEQLSKSYQDLRERQQVIQREMNVARRVQETIIPASLHRENMEIDVGYVPILEIGGDLGLVIEQARTRYDVAIADVTGHGIGAALVVNRAYTLLAELYRSNAPIDALFHRLDYYFAREISDLGLFMTMFACRFDLTAMEVEYGGAGHPPPLLYRPDDGTIVQLACRCGILGVGNIYCDEPPLERMSIRTGDMVVLYTDGLVEAINAQGEPFGQKRLEETVRGFQRDGRKLANTLIEAAKSFTGGYFQDDVLVLVVEIK